MDAELIFSQLANFGFPVMLSWYLLIRMESKLDKLTESISALTANIRARRKLKTACADKTMKKQPDRAVFSLPCSFSFI